MVANPGTLKNAAKERLINNKQTAGDCHPLGGNVKIHDLAAQPALRLSVDDRILSQGGG